MSGADIAAIVVGLTEAQRDWLVSKASTGDQSESEIQEACPEWDQCSDLGLCDYWTDELTHLGFRVRAALMSQYERAGGQGDGTA